MATNGYVMQEVQTQLPTGALIQGHYIVESLLGKGDFGTIYLVRDRDKKPKLFVLAEVLNPNEEESYHFTLEYVAPTSLDYQALPRVQYVFKDEKLDRTFVLMSYIEEPTLEILRLQQPQKRFPLSKVMAFMIPVINALNYLHHQNPPVIHQNINPTNIIISRMLHSPVLIMLDLLKECNSTTTTLHSFAPGYSAPEQYGKDISIRTDIYALGATCYTLLTGCIPPDALDRFSQLNEGEADPLKPLNETLPTIPTCIVETIHQSMSLHADDRFSSVQQFEQALQGNVRSQEAPVLKSDLILAEQDLSLKADPVEQKLLESMTASTSTTQTDPVEQQLPEPILAPSLPPALQEPVPEDSLLLAATEELPAHEEVPLTMVHEELPTPEIGPAVSGTQEPLVPEEATITIADGEPSTPEIGPLTATSEEPPVLEVVSSAANQSSTIPDKAAPSAAESLPGQPPTVLSRKSHAARSAPSRQTVEKPTVVSKAKLLRTRKVGMLLIAMALVMSFGIVAILWSDMSGYPVSYSRAPVQNVQASKLTSTPSPDSSMYPMFTGTYGGTIYDLSRNISTSISLTDMRQSQGIISGYLTLGPSMQGSGYFSGTITTTKEVKFVVTDPMGTTTLFFEGVMQSETNLTGDYYRCSSTGLSQGGTCKQAPGSYGIWNIVLLS